MRLRWISTTALLALLATACASAPPPRPARAKRAKVARAAPPPVELKYVDECMGKFREDPASYRAADRRIAGYTVEFGGEKLEQSNGVEDHAKYGELLVEALQHYKKGLIADPYSAEATLGLAVTYDKLYRKGCALMLLKRLSQLESHPFLQPDARRVIGKVEDDRTMFAGYRNEALAAVGR